MKRVKCGLCDLPPPLPPHTASPRPRVIPQVHMLINDKYLSSPASSAFQLGFLLLFSPFFCRQIEEGIKSVRVCNGR